MVVAMGVEAEQSRRSLQLCLVHIEGKARADRMCGTDERRALSQYPVIYPSGTGISLPARARDTSGPGAPQGSSPNTSIGSAMDPGGLCP